MCSAKKTKPTERSRGNRARPAAEPATVGEWLGHAITRYEREGVALGQIADNAHDEALYLLLRTLALPLDSDESVLARRLTGAETKRVRALWRRRIDERTPAAYLTNEAWLGEHRFYVDERVIAPRSYFLELIDAAFDRWLPETEAVTRAVDVCTGSGCLAILLAHRYPKATVDAVDLSPDALAVAAINVKEHRLGQRVRLHRSDVLDTVPAATYDLILSNPPYEPSALCDHLPPEFRREPRMALDGGADGLDIVRKLLRQAKTRLAPHGIVTIEVGGLQAAMNREFKALKPVWLETTDGSNCVCVIEAARLPAWRG